MMGKLQMDREWTEQDLRAFAEGAQAAFETVLLDELPQDTGWQDEGLQVSYALCRYPVLPTLLIVIALILLSAVIPTILFQCSRKTSLIDRLRSVE